MDVVAHLPADPQAAERVQMGEGALLRQLVAPGLAGAGSTIPPKMLPWLGWELPAEPRLFSPWCRSQGHAPRGVRLRIL